MPKCAPGRVGTPMALGQGGEEPAEAFCSALALGEILQHGAAAAGGGAP